MTTGQPPAFTILYMYCTGGTECLSHTPSSHSHHKVSGCSSLLAAQVRVLGSIPSKCRSFLLSSIFVSNLSIPMYKAKSFKQNKLQRCSRVIRPVPAAGQNPNHLVSHSDCYFYIAISAWVSTMVIIIILKLYCEVGQMLLPRHCDWLCSI